MKVTFSKSTVEYLAKLGRSENDSDRKLGKSIFMQLSKRLPFDPYPNIDSRKETFQSMPFMALKAEGIDVTRLKSSEYLKYRVFYIVDEDADCIFILHIVEKNLATYNLDSEHVKAIKKHYFEYYQNRIT